VYYTAEVKQKDSYIHIKKKSHEANNFQYNIYFVCVFMFFDLCVTLVRISFEVNLLNIVMYSCNVPLYILMN